MALGEDTLYRPSLLVRYLQFQCQTGDDNNRAIVNCNIADYIM